MKNGFCSAAVVISLSGLVVGYSRTADAQSEAQDRQTVPQAAESGPASSAAQGAGGDQTNAVDQPAQTEGADAPPPPPPPPSAADISGPGSSQSGGLETVVVTARRTEENIQKVPVAVTAFSSKDLERQQISSPQDLNGIVPSFSIGTGATVRNAEMPTIRGQGANISASPGVIIYYDDVPLPSDIFFTSQGGPGKFFDIANLQVLKGSQGTLFGRNTTGGALVLSPHKPDPNLSLSVKSELGNYQAKGVEAVVNAPLVEDQLYLRAGVKFYDRKGYTDDISTGQDLDNSHFRTMRLGLLWKPTDDLENYLLGYYTHSADNGTSEVLERINNSPAGCIAIAAASLIGGLGNTNCGQTVLAAQQAMGVRTVATDTAPNDINDTGGAVDNLSYQMLGGDLTLRNIVSYQFLQHHYRWDQDGSLLPINAFIAPDDVHVNDSEQYTDELQAQGKAFSGDLNYTTGLYYQYVQPRGPNKNLASQFGLIQTRVNYDISSRSYGPYTQATYNMGGLFSSLDGLNITAGARWSRDKIIGSTQTGLYSPGGVLIAGQADPVNSNLSSSALTYTAGVDYKVPTTMLYAKVSKGYKSGGISPQAVTPSRLTFKPEYVLNYEIGTKSDFWIGGMPVRLNSALYYTDYTDIQKTATDNNGIQFGAATVNAAKASIEGFETELTMQPMENLTVLANYSYTYGKYSQFNLQLATLTPQPDCSGQQHVSGDMIDLKCVPMTYIPRHQGSLTTRYQLPVSEALGSMDGNVTFSYIDKQYTSQLTVPFAEPGAWLGGYGLLNASFDWTSIYGSPFDLQLFGTNLTDRTYRVSNSNIWSFLYFQSSIYGAPRMFGMSLSYHWKQ